MPPKPSEPNRRKAVKSAEKKSRRAASGNVSALSQKTDTSEQKYLPKTLDNRNAALHSLRGLAILLMTVDHACGILGSVKIAPDTIRFATRLSLPLFAVLMGFLFAASSRSATTNESGETRDDSPTRRQLGRWTQIAAAAVVANLMTYAQLGKLEILASFYIVYGLYLLLGQRLQWLLIALPFFQFDPSIPYFDYSLLLVASLVACGIVLGRSGLQVALPVSLAMVAVSLPLIPAPSGYVVWFLPLAVLMVSGANQWRELQHPWLAKLGRFPLTAYLIQYAAIMLIKILSTLR